MTIIMAEPVSRQGPSAQGPNSSQRRIPLSCNAETEMGRRKCGSGPYCEDKTPSLPVRQAPFCPLPTHQGAPLRVTTLEGRRCRLVSRGGESEARVGIHGRRATSLPRKGETFKIAPSAARRFPGLGGLQGGSQGAIRYVPKTHAHSPIASRRICQSIVSPLSHPASAKG